LVFKLKPQDTRFFDYFEESAEAICEGADLLNRYFTEKGDPEAMLERINQVEDQGDQIYLDVMNQINNSFITPFDREDILWLAQELNRVLDHIQGTMEKMVIYKVGRPKEIYVPTMVSVLVKATEEIRQAVQWLRNNRSNNAQIIEACERIRAYEREGDDLYRAGIARLFEQTDDVVEIIKWKEIYEHLEATLDNCEAVSNVLKEIAVKYV